MISFRSASKVYPDGTSAVTDLSVDIPTGRITVFVGPSGCGKTTSLRMINRMVEPTSGSVLIDGTDTRTVDAPTLRRGIGYVIQDAGLFPHRTVLDNIATVPVLQGRRRRAARAAAADLLERVGLPASLGRRYPAQLSGGQAQRVGVARALAADPPVMLMDEPFSAVDPVVRAQLQAEFTRLQSELGKTIVFVTHDIDEAVKLGDHIAVFAVGGRLAQFGSPSQVLTRPADDFVADFVGRDRGYRALSFLTAPDLRVHPEPTLTLGQPIPNGPARSGATPDGAGELPIRTANNEDHWVLVVDDQGRPRGWLDRDRVSGHRPVTVDDLVLGGSLAGPDAPLRTVLDAALSSPSGRGVAVDADEVVIGSVLVGDVLAAIETARRNSRRTADDGVARDSGQAPGAGAGPVPNGSAPSGEAATRKPVGMPGDR